jgi:hypothetical protein
MQAELEILGMKGYVGKDGNSRVEIWPEERDVRSVVPSCTGEDVDGRRLDDFAIEGKVDEEMGTEYGVGGAGRDEDKKDGWGK